MVTSILTSLARGDCEMNPSIPLIVFAEGWGHDHPLLSLREANEKKKKRGLATSLPTMLP